MKQARRTSAHRVEAAAEVVPTRKVYCPICTHTVEAEVKTQERRMFVRPGQKCPRCSGSLDAGYILPPVSYVVRAA